MQASKEKQGSPKWVRYALQSISGIRLSQLVPIETYNNGDGSIAISQVNMFFPSCEDIVIPESGAKIDEEVLLVPDKKTFRILPWHKAHAICFAYIRKKDEEKSELEWCPRTQINRAVKALAELGLEIKCGFEIEVGLHDAKTYEVIEHNTINNARSLEE